MFEFLAASALFGLGLLVIPILLHIFKPRKVRQTPFSSLRWLRASQHRISRRIQWHQVLLFLLRAAFISLLVLALAKPIRRSTASGGAVHIRSVASALGFDLSVAASRLRRSRVTRRAALTCSVVLTRVDRNARGANRMNHWLNWSTKAAMSAFQRCGLSAFNSLRGIADVLHRYLT